MEEQNISARKAFFDLTYAMREASRETCQEIVEEMIRVAAVYYHYDVERMAMAFFEMRREG